MYGKILIQCRLEVLTGMHIGGSDAFSAIGAVDKPVIRDPRTNEPMLPGSSLKGKMRTLLARSISQDVKNMPDFAQDAPVVRRLFGAAGDMKVHTRLQFSDAFVCNAEQFRKIGLTEVKAENGINRRTSEANPRQIERVNRGVCFDVRIAYDAIAEDEIEEDFETIARGMKLLQYEYVGGHGTRGYGRVRFNQIHLIPLEIDLNSKQVESLQQILEEGCAELEVLRI